MSNGEVTGEPPTGVYFGDTRIIRSLEYTLDSQRVLPNTVRKVDFSLVYKYDTPLGGFTRSVEVGYGGLIERVNPAPPNLRLRLTPDFSDIFEVRGIVSRDSLGLPKPKPSLTRAGEDIVVRYTGTDGRDLGFIVRTSMGILLDGGLEASPMGSDLTLHILFKKRLRKPLNTYRRHVDVFPKISSDNHLLVDAYESSVRDLFSLLEFPPRRCFPLAGVPYFNCVFGRDSLIVGLQTLMFFPKIGLDVLETLATHIGRRVDPYTEEEPGRVVHEIRRGEISGRLTPFKSYYGSVDSTPLFVALYHEFVNLHPNINLSEDVGEAVELGLNWVTSKLDGQGLLGYFPGVLRNQGWKDSEDSVFYSDGSPLVPPIYLVEAQGYAEWALRLASNTRDHNYGRGLLEIARRIREKIEAAFWSSKIGYYSEAVDGRGRSAEIVTSNPGHLLWSGSVGRLQAGRIASKLVDPNHLNSGYGVKTLGFHEPRHNPESYHNGSIWPHENSLIIKGLSEYGFNDELGEIVSGFLKAYKSLGLGGFPEHYSGVSEDSGAKPKPLGCYPQAWAAGAVFLVTQAMLGISVARENHEYIVRIQPRLPENLTRIKIGDLYVLGGRLRVSVEKASCGEYKVTHEFTVKPKVEFRVEV
ncbi:MAG: hypothetical protein QW453_06415 [Thermoprotei archaeon]